eukprot:12125_1
MYWLVLLLQIICIKSSKWHPDRLDSDIYYWISNEAKCVRLSTIHNRTGCGTYNDGMHAQLRYVSNRTEIENLINENPIDYKIAIVMPLSLLTINLLNNLSNNLTLINGIIFLRESDNDEILSPPFISNGYSSDSNSPFYYLKPKSHKFNYIWNPYGTFNNLREYKFSIITISSSESYKIKEWAKSNENNIKVGKFGSYFVEFTYPMFGRNDSKTCLEKDNCLPVGGYSVWTTFQDYNINKTEIYNISIKSKNNLIFAITSMDTTCLFHQNICRGGNSNIGGLVGWLASIKTLSKIKNIFNNKNNTYYNLIDKQIIFIAFQGESYDLVGSRKFVYDLQNNTFECKKLMNIKQSGYGCWEPYTSNMDFKKLNLSNINSIIELNQIGMSHKDNDNNQIIRKLYAHYERESSQLSNNYTQNIINNAQIIANKISLEQSMGFSIELANSTDLPGTPPSSYWSFLNSFLNNNNNNNIPPGIVLTDHPKQYRNKWYHSVYDSYYNNLNIEQICMTSTLYARLLYKISLQDPSTYNETFVSQNINADCLLVEQLLECFLLDMTCDLVSNFAPKSKDASPTHYTSVYRIIEDDDIHSTPKFVFRFIANLTRKSDNIYGSCSKNLDCAGKGMVCGGTNHGKYCMDSYTYFHAAVDTNLKFNYKTNRWSINKDILIHNGTPLIFTESMWNSNIGTRFYEKESDKTQIFMFIVGILMIIINFIVIWRFKKYCKKKFPYLSRGNK